MCNRFTKIAYWISGVLPVFDMIKGFVKGVSVVYLQVHKERIEEEARTKLQQQITEFTNDN